MDSGLHWSIWLLAGMGTGMLPLLGEHRLVGFLQAALVISSPLIIFTQAGTAYLPFLLFYGGLIAVSSLLFRRKQAQDDRKRREGIARAKKKHWGA